MSRHDKRAGRVKYTRDREVFENFGENMLKAKFGKFWNHEMAIPVLMLGVVDSVFLRLSSTPLKRIGVTIQKEVRRVLEKQIQQWLSEKTNNHDPVALAGYAYLVSQMKMESAVDPEAFQILMSYYAHKRGEVDKVSPRKSLNSTANPSGKELASKMEELRKERGETPSSKTLEAIRERAIRLGLKLKGKRSKKK